MPRVTISGYYGFNNAGDEAMLSAIIRSIGERMDGVEFLVLSADPEQTSREHGVESVRRTDLKRILRELKRTDLLISGGGSLLQDVTSGRSLGYYVGIIYLGRKLCRRVMLYGHGVGPVRRWLGRTMVRIVLNGVDLITVRDRDSALELERLRVTRPPVVVTADPAFALEQDINPELGARILREELGLPSGLAAVGISLRPARESGRYLRLVSAVADMISERLRANVVFVPMQWPQDKEISQRAAGLMRNNAYVLKRRHSFSELLQIISSLQLVAGMRLHSLIFAAIAGVPVVGLACDPKISSFLGAIGEKPAVDFEDISVDQLFFKLEQAFRRAPLDRDAKSREISNMRRMALRNAEMAVELLRSRRR